MEQSGFGWGTREQFAHANQGMFPLFSFLLSSAFFILIIYMLTVIAAARSFGQSAA